MNEKGRSAIYTAAGIYLLFMAYNIFNSRNDSVGTEYMLMIAFSILFLLFGIGLIGFAIYMMKKK